LPYVIALICLLSLLCLLNLLFTYGVILRLREHSGLLANRGGQRGNEAGRRPRPTGDAASEFTAVTLDGEEVTRDSLPASSVVAFMSSGCKPCEEAVPDFLAYAATVPAGRSHVLVVVSGPPSETAAYAARFTSMGRVVVEEPNGVVHSAFAVDGAPAFAFLGPGGMVTTATRKVAELPAAVSA
jgi:thiol-disulfide isomerase/thioredoxin